MSRDSDFQELVDSVSDWVNKSVVEYQSYEHPYLREGDSIEELGEETWDWMHDIGLHPSNLVRGREGEAGRFVELPPHETDSERLERSQAFASVKKIDTLISVFPGITGQVFEELIDRLTGSAFFQLVRAYADAVLLKDSNPANHHATPEEWITELLAYLSTETEEWVPPALSFSGKMPEFMKSPTEGIDHRLLYLACRVDVVSAYRRELFRTVPPKSAYDLMFPARHISDNEQSEKLHTFDRVLISVGLSAYFLKHLSEVTDDAKRQENRLLNILEQSGIPIREFVELPPGERTTIIANVQKAPPETRTPSGELPDWLELCIKEGLARVEQETGTVVWKGTAASLAALKKQTNVVESWDALLELIPRISQKGQVVPVKKVRLQKQKVGSPNYGFSSSFVRQLEGLSYLFH